MSEIFSASAALVGSDAASDNARALRRESREAASQGYRNEEAQRREARQYMGTAAAMIAETGSAGGSSEKLLQQNELLAELDALNIRYGGLQRRKQLRSAAKSQDSSALGSLLDAGGSLLLAFHPRSSTRSLLNI